MPRYYCPSCGRETEHVSVRRAAEVAQVTRRTMYNWIRSQWVHGVEHASGRRFICVESILKRIGEPQWDADERSSLAEK